MSIIGCASDGTGATGVVMTGGPQALSNGVSITFAADTGHTPGDQWGFSLTITNGKSLYLDTTARESTIGDRENIYNGTNLLVSDNAQTFNMITDQGGTQAPLMVIGTDFLSWGLGQLINTRNQVSFAGEAANPLEVLLLGLDEHGGVMTPVTIRTTNPRDTIDANAIGNDLIISTGLSTGNVVGGTLYFESSLSGAPGPTLNTATRWGKITGGEVSFGDINSINNGTFITVDDISQLVTISNVPTYADDAAAVVGGLTTGQLYKTTTGGITSLNIVP